MPLTDERSNNVLKNSNHDSIPFPLCPNRSKKTDEKVTKEVISKENKSSSSSEKKIMNMEQNEVSGSTSSMATAKACICSPTSHAGSFRCHLHRASVSSCKMNITVNNNNNKSLKSKNVRTKGDGLARLSRFGRAASDRNCHIFGKVTYAGNFSLNLNCHPRVVRFTNEVIPKLHTELPCTFTHTQRNRGKG
ncbi:uncharacterized protein LOC133783446 [Humulus lupulus]|uniref:uncharacterized protein LOC133783446 n=1 Tax=Humulus lupulus TaxID=3486 RepID=UPI002B401561|nr:uncharacterized protein LOC133783446 [Humulus lupulus]